MYIDSRVKGWDVRIKKNGARKLATEMPSFLRMSSETKKVHARRRSTNE